MNSLPEVPRVLYIMGTARSGSTIMEILLSRPSGVFGAGELTSIVQDGFLDDGVCSCKETVSECEVWGRVKSELGLSRQNYEEWANLQKRIDWHSGLVRQLFGITDRAEKLSYADLNRRLLATIQRITGCSWIVDSSKYAARALALHRMEDMDVRVICLTRSPAGLMNSFQKPNKFEQKPKSVYATLAYFFVTLLSLRIVTWLLGDRVLEVRYEELLSDPLVVIRRIGEWIGLDFGDSMDQIEKQKPFDVGHIVTGNRIRKEGAVLFRSGSPGESDSGKGKSIPLRLMKIWQWILRF